MVAQPIQHDETEQGLVATPPQTALELARNQLEWLWNVFVDEQGQERVEGATLALNDVYNAIRAQQNENDKLFWALEAASVAFNDMQFQRDVAARELQEVTRRGVKATRKEIAERIGNGILGGNYGDQVVEDLMLVLTGDDDQSLSGYTLRDLRYAIDAAADELAQAYDYPVQSSDADFYEDEDDE